jgi:hypothetical protein
LFTQVMMLAAFAQATGSSVAHAHRLGEVDGRQAGDAWP